jgi:hypothetical protein
MPTGTDDQILEVDLLRFEVGDGPARRATTSPRG